MNREIGELIFDSKRAEGTCGSRSSIVTDRSLVFRGDNLSVDLVVCRSAGELEVLHGQIIHEPSGDPVSVASVRLGQSGEEVLTDEHGQFAVSTVQPHGAQFLWITAPDQEFLCPIPGRGQQEGV